MLIILAKILKIYTKVKEHKIMYNQYKIYLNGQDITSRCNQGFPIKQCLNESLDSATKI